MRKKKLTEGLVYGLAGMFTAAFIALNLAGIVTLIVFCFSPFAFAGNTIAQNEQINAQCLTCHGQPGYSVQKDGKKIDLYVDPAKYKSSIHASRACTACHNDLGGVPHTNPVYGKDLSAKVNQRCIACHSDAGKAYKTSVHAQALNGKEGALCSDCHDTHNILKSSNSEASTYRLNILATCTKCHQGNVQQSYNYSFHGSSLKLGYSKSATCVDCHSDHNILAPANPQSTVNKQNVPQTCAKCHLQAKPNFAAGNEHVVPQDKNHAFPLWIIWKIFLALILFDVTKDGSIAIFELIRRSLNNKKTRNKMNLE